MNCIDTDMAIAVLRGDRKAGDLLREMESDGPVCITAVSVFELHRGAASVSRERGRALDDFLESLTILSLDGPAARDAARLCASLASDGQSLDPMDALIGAVAARNGMPLATRNSKHMGRIRGLTLRTW